MSTSPFYRESGYKRRVSTAISVDHLDFRYPAKISESVNDQPLVLSDLTLSVPAGARCLLVGANGAGKTTLLYLLAGRYLVAPERVRVLGCAAFHDTSLTTRRSFLGGLFPLDVDITVREILDRQLDVEPARKQRLLQLLDIDLGWRMHRVSDGQRRRVQVLLGLLRPCEVLLLDEVTTDLDVIARADLLAFLREESEQRGMTIVYATHIFDGLDAWATHLLHLSHGKLRLLDELPKIGELSELRQAGESSPLLRLVERWLRRDARP